eukprot:Tamp_01585.p1 GENE.Tamp_01585~~Tamp_01585.p1  ORF type:complete len:985 (-),score=213.21 Tamp_01585:2222-5083(-)
MEGAAKKKFPIEGVSWLEQTFDMAAARSSADQKPLTLSIPDTVVFRYQRPAAIYTNDAAEENQVACRDELSDLSADAICQRFVKRQSAPDRVCALYIYNDRHSHDAEADEQEEAAQDAQNVVVEYMNPAQLRHFLQHRTKVNNGILQRFLPSKGAFHNTIRVMWTPRTCHVETRTNRHKADDVRLSVTDRLSTFDGGPHLSVSHSLKDGLFYKSIKEAADALVRHVESLIPRPYQVWEMVLYFKYCASERGANEKSGISFLWCSSLRVYKDELLDLRRLDAFWTSEIKTEVMHNKEAPDKDLKVKRCPVTGKEYKEGTDTDVKVGTIVKYMTVLATSHPGAAETLKFMQEAAELDEQGDSKAPAGGRGSVKNTGEEAIREIINEMMTKKTAARDVCDLIKRVLFGNPGAPDAAKIRAIFNHETFLHQTISVSEDTALDSAIIVERESVRTAAKSTPSNEATQMLARGARAHMKKKTAPGLMPATVVEVKAIVVGQEKGRDGQAKARRMSASKSPVGHGDALGSVRSLGSWTNGGTLSHIGMMSHVDSTEPGSIVPHHRHVDLNLGTSKILSFRRLRYRPMGAPAVRGPVTVVETPIAKETPSRSPEAQPGSMEAPERERNARAPMPRTKEAAGAGGVYSKLSDARSVRDWESTEGNLDSSVISQASSIGMTDARQKVLGQYVAFDKTAATDELRGPSRSRPPPLHLDHEAGSGGHRDAKALNPRIERPYSEYKPVDKTKIGAAHRVPLRPASAQHRGTFERQAAPASGIKHYKQLDSGWSHAMRDKSMFLLPSKDRLAGETMEPERASRLLSAKSRSVSVGSTRIASASGREQARASSAASTRVSSAVSSRRAAELGARGGPHDWSDGDLIDDDDDEDWDDGLEMDLPSTHVRLKREQELRASREGDRMLRRGKERKDSNTPATSGSSMPLCLQWGLDDRVRAKVLQQYSAYG